MTGRHDLDATLPWMRQGTAHILGLVGELTDDDLQAPSALPGWSRGHIVGHLARNAEALVRLATWAQTGVEASMYPSRERRNAEIEESAALPGATLRREAVTTARALVDALAALGADAWAATIRSAMGRAIPATEIPWMRIREVWLHAVDLDTGTTVHDLPGGVVDLLLEDVSGTLSRKDGCPDVVLAPTDRDRTWQLGATGGVTGGVTVAAPAAELMGWLTGRSTLPGEAPALPTWL